MSSLQRNRTPLSAIHCARLEKKLVFEPQSEHEAGFIAKELQAMGFGYYKSEYAGQLNNAVTGCIYLDTDKTIMVSGDKRDDGLLCSVDDFENFYIPENMAKVDSRLTAQDIADKTLAFYPRTGAEARGIYAALVEYGAVLDIPEQNTTTIIASAVTQGMIVKKGTIGYAPTAQDLVGAEICTAADLGFNSASALSAEQITIMAAFNEMAARMGQMAQRIARLEGEILPQKIEKKKPTAPALKK